MAKKYVPSGYQIISVHGVYDDDSNPVIEESEDSKLLLNILQNKEYKKPILLKIKDNTDYDGTIFGFGIIGGSTISVRFINWTFYIGIAGGKLTYTVSED